MFYSFLFFLSFFLVSGYFLVTSWLLLGCFLVRSCFANLCNYHNNKQLQLFKTWFFLGCFLVASWLLLGYCIKQLKQQGLIPFFFSFLLFFSFFSFLLVVAYWLLIGCFIGCFIGYLLFTVVIIQFVTNVITNSYKCSVYLLGLGIFLGILGGNFYAQFCKYFVTITNSNYSKLGYCIKQLNTLLSYWDAL